MSAKLSYILHKGLRRARSIFERNGRWLGVVFFVATTAVLSLAILSDGVGWWAIAAAAILLYAYLTPPGPR